jgi:acyl carrier protein
MQAAKDVSEAVISVMLAQRGYEGVISMGTDARLDDDMGYDSLERAELLMLLEETFGFELKDNSNSWVTVLDVVKAVEAGIQQSVQAR